MDDDIARLLSKEQTDIAMDWIFKQWKQAGLATKCEICNTTNWVVQSYLVSPMLVDIDFIKFGKVSPSLVMICSQCGNTKYINVMTSGLSQLWNKHKKTKENPL